MSTSRNIPIDYFKHAVLETLKKLIERDENVYKFPKISEREKIAIICNAADEMNMHWKMIGDGELIVIRNLAAFNDNKFELRSSSVGLVVQMMEIIHGEVDKENVPTTSSPRTPTASAQQASSPSRTLTPVKESCILSVPPKTTSLNDLNRPSVAIHRDNFMNIFSNAQMVLVQGRAGCGKSTQIPSFILDHHAEFKLPCRILVVNPRKICAVSGAECVSKQLGEEIGKTAGYQVQLESKSSPTSNLIYASAGHILSKLMHVKPDDFFKNVTALIIDEIQERDSLIDFLILIARELIDKKQLKVVLMTSGVADELVEYFKDIKVFTMFTEEQELITPTIAHLEDILQIDNVFLTADQLKSLQVNLVKIQPSESESTTYGKLLMKRYKELCSKALDFDLIAKLVKHLHCTTSKSNTILIFLPGYNEILLLADKLFNMIDPNCEIIPIHSQMQSNDQTKIFQKLPATVRKIVLSTNLAETMLTIDDVEYVIDTGKERFDTFDASTQISSSCVNWICKRSADQRATRVSNPNRGKVFRLYSSEQYACFDAKIEPAIVRSDITKLCLMSKFVANSQSIEDFLARALTKPPQSTIDRSIAMLQKIGALFPDESLTPLGKCLVDLPLPLQYAKMLIYAIFLRCIDPILTMVSILAVGVPFTETEDDNDCGVKICDIKKRLQEGSFSDLFVMLRAFQKWNEYKTSKIFDTSFCEQYSVGSGTLEMISLFRVRLVGHLRLSKMVPSVGNISPLNEQSNNWSVLKACIVAGLYPNVANVHGEVKTLRGEKVELHPESSLLTTNYDSSVINWIAFDKKMQDMNGQMLIDSCTIVSDFCIAMFAGNGIELQHEITSNDTRSICYNIAIDDCIQLTGSEATAKALKFLRDRLTQVFDKFLADICKFQLNDPCDFTIHDGICLLLKHEDEALGLKVEYEGIGSRPRIVTRELDATVSSYATDRTSSTINNTMNTTMSSLNDSVASISRNLSQIRF